MNPKGLISQRGLRKYITNYIRSRLFAVYTHSYLFNPDICMHIHSAECTVRLLNQAGRNNYPYNPKFVGNTGN